MVVIEIKPGKIRGKILKDRDGRDFFSFQNIPYGEPPIGNLRFKAPQAVKSWLGVKDATKEGNESIQRDVFTKKIIGNEDCLNLNVYSPKLPKNEIVLKPVMFWIHGGVFMMGSNKTDLYGPEFLVAEDIVLVTINYRLGILGFLSLDDSSLRVPGNAGFKDMVLALQWVHDNIQCFGGDPNNVTVFGESSGAAAAHLLMLSPTTKGLMHKVIAQSASALHLWIQGRRSGRLIAKVLGFLSSDDKKLLEFLQTKSVEDFIQAQVVIDTIDYLEKELRFFGFVIERVFDEKPFLTRHPLEIIHSGDYHHIPIIFGYNDREGMAFERLIPARSRLPFFYDMELSVPLFLKIQRGSDISQKIANEIQSFYFGNEQLDRKNPKHVTQFYNLCTDTCFFRDLYFSAFYHSKTSTTSVYFYKLSLVSELNFYKNLTNTTTPGVYHGDDIGYIFKTKFTPDIQAGSIEDVAMRRITRMWANFARYGNPTPNQDNLLKIKWKAVTNRSMDFLEIDKKLKMKVNPEEDRIEFWKKVFALNPAYSKL